MLTIDDKGGGRGVKKSPKPAYVIDGCSLSAVEHRYVASYKAQLTRKTRIKFDLIQSFQVTSYQTKSALDFICVKTSDKNSVKKTH